MTTLKSFDATGVQFAWDATSVSAFEKCPRYYDLSILQGWQPARKSEHLVFGGVYAAALERFHKLSAEGVEREEAIRTVVKLALVETWEHDRDDEGNRIPDTGRAWNSLHNSKTRGTLIRTIVWYLEEFADDTVKVITLSNGKAAAELSFSLEFADDILWCGHLDAGVEYKKGKYVMDQKTTGTTLGPYFFDQFNPDVQMGGYSWAGSIILDSPVKGVIIDAASILVGGTNYRRGFVHYSKPLLEEWHDMTNRSIDAAREATAKQNFRMNRASCGNYGGCAFRNVCNRIPEHRDRVLRSDFVQRPRWDPLEKR